MFELIGLAFATALMIGISILIGSILAFAAWFIVRGRRCRRKQLIAAAFAFPIVCAAYLWTCVAVLPGESLFGDISEKLPNGYALTGLGKMPEFSYIEKEGATYGNELAPSCVERLQVVAYLVAGQYGQQCRATIASAPLDDKFFIFDTKTGRLESFPTLPETEALLGRQTHLVDSQSFKSSEHSALRQRRIDNTVLLGPPIITALLCVIGIVRLPRSDIRPASTFSAT